MTKISINQHDLTKCELKLVIYLLKTILYQIIYNKIKAKKKECKLS